MSLNQYIRPVRTKLLHISFIRNISITQSSINTTIKNDESISKTTIPEIFNKQKLAGYRALEIPEFKTLGSAEGTTATATGSSSSSSSIYRLMYHLQCQFILDEDHYYQFMEFKKYHQLILVRSQLQFPNFFGND